MSSSCCLYLLLLELDVNVDLIQPSLTLSVIPAPPPSFFRTNSYSRLVLSLSISLFFFNKLRRQNKYYSSWDFTADRKYRT